MELDWESESYPEAKDLAVISVFAFFFYAARLFLDSFIFERLAKRLILGQKHKATTHDKRKTIIKFKESAWKCLYYLSADILALSVSYNEPWFTQTKYLWEGPGDQSWPDIKMKLGLKGLYMYVSGFYIYALFALVFWETRRSDFFVLMIHHVATLILLGMSYLLRLSRVGAIILALHDASDVFLEMGKMSLYSGYRKIASISFPLFVLSFTAFRIIYYPFWILRSTIYELFVCLEGFANGKMYYYILNTLLLCLLILNLYWWRIMCGMLVGQIRQRGKVSDDVRSDSEGEDDDHED